VRNRSHWARIAIIGVEMNRDADREAEAAIRAIGTNGIPFLVSGWTGPDIASEPYE